MIIESIELKNFRNYEILSLKLNPGSNIFYGDNAQGKTNILEAIYMGCTSKSYRMARDSEIIRFNEDDAHLKLKIRKNDLPYRIDMHLKRNKRKGIAVDEVPIKKASEIFGLANVVSFSPEDLSLTKDGPSVRRRFMDFELCQIDRLYLYHLSRYNKVLVQRNKLLKDIAFNKNLIKTLSVWDEQLVNSGSFIIKTREKFILELEKIIKEIHYYLSGGREKLDIIYEKSVEADSFMERLEETRSQEMRNQSTMTGPHRDDMIFIINGKDVRTYGSQGQQRTAALSLKLSEIKLVKNRINDEPILLLDDVLSELDSNRQNYLLDIINGTQSIITCTGIDSFIEKRFPLNDVFYVENGHISVCKHN